VDEDGDEDGDEDDDINFDINLSEDKDFVIITNLIIFFLSGFLVSNVYE